MKPILESRIAISAEMAVLLSVYFGTSDRYWIDLQAHYNLQVAKNRVRAHAARIVSAIRGDPKLMSELRYWMSTMQVVSIIGRDRTALARHLLSSVDAELSHDSD